MSVELLEPFKPNCIGVGGSLFNVRFTGTKYISDSDDQMYNRSFNGQDKILAMTKCSGKVPSTIKVKYSWVLSDFHLHRCSNTLTGLKQ